MPRAGGVVEGRSILERHFNFHSSPFNHRTDTTVIGCSGFHGDCLTLTKIIDARLKVSYYNLVKNDLVS